MNTLSNNTDFLLSVENLSVSFDGFKAVNDLNLYVDENEIRGGILQMDQRLPRGSGFPGHLEVGFGLDELGQAEPHDGVIVDDQDLPVSGGGIRVTHSRGGQCR